MTDGQPKKMSDTNNKYYFGGYYLIILRPKTYGPETGSLIYTCSECINDNILDGWSYSWTTNNNDQVAEAVKSLKISEAQIENIRKWVDNKFNDNKIGFLNVFIDLETAIEYKNKFFSHLSGVNIMAIYFDANEGADILEEFKPQSEDMGEIGLRSTLLKELEEQENETFLGYDYIGIENGGSFHTFHCHDIGKELSDKFGLTLNRNGLFESDVNSKHVLDYLNDGTNGCEPVSWYIVKTKLVSNE